MERTKKLKFSTKSTAAAAGGEYACFAVGRLGIRQRHRGPGQWWGDLFHPHHELARKRVQHNAARHCTIRYGTERYDSACHGTVRYGTLRYFTVRYGTVRYGTVLYGTVRHYTVRYCTVHYNTVVPHLRLEVSFCYAKTCCSSSGVPNFNTIRF